ncbi:MAG: sigma-70 family RNA polymerase sigma factor [Massilia sp.]
MPAPFELTTQLQALRPQLLRFAVLQLRDQARAEDAVQDALIAVLEQPERYAGRASLRSYVTGILKFKIIDAIRACSREQAVEDVELLANARAEDEAIDGLFLPDGHTREMPAQWGDPERVFEQQDFFRVLEVCVDKLPAQTARIFMMREWLEFDTDEICTELAVTSANVWVVLYRARLRLRECLDLNWFGKTP